MLNRTITKKLLVVIFSVPVLLLSASCHDMAGMRGTPPSFDPKTAQYGPPVSTGRVESVEITESSGITASKCQNDVLWTHNDSGDGAFIFAIDGKGQDLGTWRVRNAENIDWEDIASFRDVAGNCFLYIGDIGKPSKDRREIHRIYRVAEPTVSPSDPETNRAKPAETSDAEVIQYAYPERRRDAETLLVHPVTEAIYVVTKEKHEPAEIYKLKNQFGMGVQIAAKIGDLTVPAIPNGFLTGGDIAPDGKRLIICDYFAAYEFGLPVDAVEFDNIWKQKPTVVELGARKQGEAIGYSANGSSVFTTSEGKNQPIIRLDRVRH